MKCEKIFEKFIEITPSFSEISNYESLALHELLFIWEQCTSNESIHNSYQVLKLEPMKRDVLEEIRKKDVCIKCYKNHQGRRCPAFGQKCWKCGDYNHFARCCLKTYVKDCPYCGGNHVQYKCSAFAKECSRCKKIGHFPWKCLTEVVHCCDFCGQSHRKDRSICPAINSTCTNCHKLGHFSFKCRARRNSFRR